MLESKKLIKSEKKLIESENQTLKYVYCRCLLEMFCNNFIKFHEENKRPDCLWLYDEEIRPKGLLYVTSTADHITAPCFNLQTIGFPTEFSGLADLWKKLSRMVHFSGGTVFIPAGALLDTEQKLVYQLAKYLKLDTEIIPETP
ncbi:hypothetical protein QOT17_024388 [Balamuthia mandrillaris]